MTRIFPLLLLTLLALPARAEPPAVYTVTLTAEQLGYIAQWLRGDSGVCAPPWNKANPIISSLGAQVDRQIAEAEAKAQAQEKKEQP